MYQKRGFQRQQAPIIKLWQGSDVGLRKLRGDVESGGKWVAKKSVKVYRKHKTLKGTKVYRFIDEGLVRYTVVFQDGSVYILSENPLSPMGVIKYLGNVYEDERIKPFGKKTSISNLPWEVRSAIKKIMEE